MVAYQALQELLEKTVLNFEHLSLRFPLFSFNNYRYSTCNFLSWCSKSGSSTNGGTRTGTDTGAGTVGYSTELLWVVPDQCGPARQADPPSIRSFSLVRSTNNRR